MLSDVLHLQVGIVGRHAVVECLLVMLKLATKVSHPVNVEFSRVYVEGPRIEALAERLTFDQAVKDAVHGHLCLELLISRADASDQVLIELGRLTVAISCRLLNSSLVLESTTGRAVAQIAVGIISEEVGLSILALKALIDDLGSLSLVLLLLLCLAVLILCSHGQVDQLLLCGLLW